MVIVKLGGSLFHSPFLKAWLKKVNQLAQVEPIIIVPGGGPFADQVRQAQQLHQLPNQQAHHMALLAMSQFGLMLLGLEQQALPFYYPSKQTKNNQPALSIWLPDKALLTQQDIKQNWDVTSDSLALWLAKELKPNKITLIKHQVPQQCSIEQLVNKKVLDNAFSAHAERTQTPIELVDITQVNTYTLTAPRSPLLP